MWFFFLFGDVVSLMMKRDFVDLSILVKIYGVWWLWRCVMVGFDGGNDDERNLDMMFVITKFPLSLNSINKPSCCN